MNIGVLGCGNISGIYLQNLHRLPGLRVVAAADLDPAKLDAIKAQYPAIDTTLDAAELFDRTDIDLIANLTTPKAHFQTVGDAMRAGKHVYVEKPLGISVAEARELVELAESKGVMLGCAPDTALGAGIQTAKAAIEGGNIGDLVGANAFMLCPGHESWHPAPAFYYEVGGGPMFDMGPYYLTALFHLMGPAEEVCSFSSALRPTRTITSQPLAGTVVPVETPTHVAALIRYANGAIGQITTSFDVEASTLPWIEVYGTEGTLLVPDPNGFGGDVKLKRRGDSDWQVLPHIHTFSENWRGLGVAEMNSSHALDRQSRIRGDIALHVVEIMEASVMGGTQRIVSAPAMPPLFDGQLT